MNEEVYKQELEKERQRIEDQKKQKDIEKAKKKARWDARGPEKYLILLWKGTKAFFVGCGKFLDKVDQSQKNKKKASKKAFLKREKDPFGMKDLDDMLKK